MPRSRSRGKRGKGGGGEESGERWLLTYADMITLLMALFMVLFSISSVNISKYEEIQHALKAAFSGDILPGGKSIAKPGATANSSKVPSTADVQAIVPLDSSSSSSAENGNPSHSAAAAQAAAQHAQQVAAQEASQFAAIKQRLDAYAAKHGFSSDVSTTIDKRGLVIRVLTDRLLFPSGQATLIAQARPLLKEISELLNLDRSHPVAVEGNTDNVPIRSGNFPSNWELSTARASMVVRELISSDVSPERLSAAGYSDLRPIASNTTAAGRARNRRVEIVLQRLGTESSAP
jgi:chemotaxis protein MotB